MTADRDEIARLEKEREEGVETYASGEFRNPELSECDVEKPAEVFGRGCGCGCEGICGDEQEQDDGAEEEGDWDVGEPDYELTSGQIDSLIVLLKELGQKRNGEIKSLFDEDELGSVWVILEDQWRHKRMTEGQAEAFWDACGYL